MLKIINGIRWTEQLKIYNQTKKAMFYFIIFIIVDRCIGSLGSRRIWLLFRVVLSIMLNITRLRKDFDTYWTNIWIFSCVCFTVRFKVSISGKIFFTWGAVKGFYSCMSSCMNPKLIRAREILVTPVAGILLIYFVWFYMFTPIFSNIKICFTTELE